MRGQELRRDLYKGEADDLLEQAFLYTGTLEDVPARANEMAKQCLYLL